MYSQRVKAQLNLSMPSALECLIIILISMTDTFFVSSLGSKSIAAVGAMLSIIFFINLIMKSVQVSNNVTVAHLLGAKEIEQAQIMTGNAILLTIFAQIIAIVLTLIISPVIPGIFKVSDICLTYLYIRLIGLIPSGVGMVVSGYQRTIGNPKFIMDVKILSFFLNIVLDYIAIKLNLKIAGVALATVIVETINTLILLIYSKKTIVYKINKKYILELLNLTKYGIEGRIFDRGAKLFLNIILSRIGVYEYAAHVVISKFEDLVNDFCYGFSVGITTTTGILISKKNKDDYIESRKATDKIIKVFTLVLPTLILILLVILLPIMLKEQLSLKEGYELIPFIVIYSMLLPNYYKYSAIILGLKEFKFITKLSVVSNLFKVILSYVLCSFFGIKGYWITFILVAIVTIIVSKYKEKKAM